MNAWLAPALLSVLSFGLWGLFSKLTVNEIDMKSALVFQSLGVFLVGLFTLSMIHFKPTTTWKGVTLGIATGLFSGIGCLLYLTAVSKTKSSTVVTLTALYPIVTILLSIVVLREGLQMRQAIGILLALFSIYLLS